MNEEMPAADAVGTETGIVQIAKPEPRVRRWAGPVIGGALIAVNFAVAAYLLTQAA